jgi:ligand-binding SRPBCC domain-containing protein
MSIHTIQREQFIPSPIEEVFSFFADTENLETITPAWLNFRILTAPQELRAGAHLDYRLKWHGVPLQWRTEILTWKPPFAFTDVQLRGPYRLWHHVHTFVVESNGTRMIDLVSYQLPLGAIGEAAHFLLVRRDLQRIFDFRRDVIESCFSSTATRR